MKKTILFIMLLCLMVSAQQVRYTLGQKTTSGDPWLLSDITYLDTTTSKTYDFLIDLNDFYPMDIFPYKDTSGVALLSSDHLYIGTFYGNFNAVKAADSVLYTIKAYPGVYTTDSKAFSAIAYGSAVTLETTRQVNDYFSVNNVYIHSSQYKLFPPEIIKIEVAHIADADRDDSIAFDWKFAYPQLLQQYRERKEDSENSNEE